MLVLGIVVAAVLSTVVSIATTIVLLRRAVANLPDAATQEEVTARIEAHVKPIADANRSQMDRIGAILTPLIGELRETEERRGAELSSWQSKIASHIAAAQEAARSGINGLSNRIAVMENRPDHTGLEPRFEAMDQTLEKLEGQIGDVFEQLADKASLSDLSERLARLVTRLDTIEHDQTAAKDETNNPLNQRFGALSQTVEAAVEDGASMRAELTHLQQHVTEDVDQRNSLAKRVDHVASAHSIALDNLAGQIEAITSRMDALQSVEQPTPALTRPRVPPHGQPVGTFPDATVDDDVQANARPADALINEPEHDERTLHPETPIMRALSLPGGMVSIMSHPAQPEDAEDAKQNRETGRYHT